MYNATPEQALAHPTWAMGPKNTIDSATLMNKALEVIEAHWLFGLGAGRIGVLIHPQSIVHSLVQCRDGSTIAQMGVPDMRAPIQYALTHPGRAPGQTPGLAAPAMESLTFEPADGHPAVALAYEAIRAGGTAGAVLNGANEVAVGAFLEGRIPFGRIVELACRVFERVGWGPLASIDDAIGADAAARRAALDAVGGA